MASTNATVQIPVADGTTMPAYLVGPAAGHAPTGVIVAHELFGVNPDIRGVADDLAEAGYLTNAEPRNQIRAALREAHISHELVSYPGTGHGFFWPGTPAFSLQARDDAWSRILAMLTS